MITLILLGRKFLSWKNKSLPVQRHWVSEKTFAYVHQTENGWFARIMAIQGLAQNHLAPSFSLCTSWNRALQTMTNGSSRKSDRRCANRTGISSWIQRAYCTCCSSDLNRRLWAKKTATGAAVQQCTKSTQATPTQNKNIDETLVLTWFHSESHSPHPVATSSPRQQRKWQMVSNWA